MAVAALAGYGVLLMAAFGVRTVLHVRRTDNSGWVRPPTAAAWTGDGLFAVGVAAVTAGPVLHLLDVPGRLGAIDGPAFNGVGALLLAAGAVVALVAQHQMGPAWRAGIDVSGQRDDLVVDGLFRFVRNPFYSGMLAASLGVALMAPHVASIAGWFAMLAGGVIDVRLIEEPHLRMVHGEAYADYERSTPRFLPRLRSLSGGGRDRRVRRPGRG